MPEILSYDEFVATIVEIGEETTDKGTAMMQYRSPLAPDYGVGINVELLDRESVKKRAFELYYESYAKTNGVKLERMWWVKQ